MTVAELRRLRRNRSRYAPSTDEDLERGPVIHVSITVSTEDTRIEVNEEHERVGLVTTDAREQAVLALMAATSRVLRMYGHAVPESVADVVAECAAAAQRLDNPAPIDEDPLPVDPVHPEVTP